LFVKKPKVILCTGIECSGCSSNPVPSKCKKTQLEELNRTIVIVEEDKKTIHLRMASKELAEDNSNPANFESVYIEQFDEIENWTHLIGVYFIESYLSLFFKDDKEENVQYYSFPRVKTSLEYSLIEEMNRRFEKDFINVENVRTEFQSRLDTISSWVYDQVSMLLPEIESTKRKVIANLIANANTPISGLFPLIMDEYIEEIYLDRPDEYVYFDHSYFGRVQSNFQMYKEDVSRLSTILRAESNLHLDRKNPSLKTDLMICNVPLRFSTSMPPLSPDGLNLEIRRARVKPFNIFDLIKNNTLSYEAAAILILSINSRLNITITGEPGTGKTTLLNALDFTTPDIWRKIYIEDVLESRVIKGKHQVRFRVTPLDETTSTLDKSTEIIKCLHRSPDYLILGEIQTAEHSHALFQSIAAGLRSIQTCHSGSPSSLITRWLVEHKISTSSLALMDIIVLLQKPSPGNSKRFVSEIVEVCRKKTSGLIEFAGLNTLYDSRYPQESEKPEKNGAFGSLKLNDMVNNLVTKLRLFSQENGFHQVDFSKHLLLNNSML